MMLMSECHVFVYEVRMMWWYCWVSALCLCMKWGWWDDLVEWVSWVCIWSKDDVMVLLNECYVFVYEVRVMWWNYWVSVMTLCMNWGWFDEVVEWVSCVCVLSEVDVMKLLIECDVLVYAVMMIWWSCWVSVMFCVWSEDDVMMLLIACHVFVYEVRMMWWVSCVSIWSEDDEMKWLSECHVFVF